MNISNNKNYSILILATKGWSTNLIFNHINKQCKNVQVIIEKKISSNALVKKRIKNIGLFKTIGQLLFIFILPPILRLFSGERIKEIITDFNINLREIPEETIHYVRSINSDQAIEKIKELKPDLILVNGTRIISKKVLEQINVPIINIHTGITPYYRGVHGGYWALYNNDAGNFGTTIHYVDKGVDTGNIIKQFRTNPKKNDNYITYPYLQYAAILDWLIPIIEKVISEKTKASIQTETEKGKMWYHPGLLQYLYAYLIKGIK